MELRQLRYFAAVARNRSFTRAADELHMVQSGLSQQVRRLESELGVELLRRTTRSVELTGAGEVVLASATRVQAEIDSMLAELDREEGRLRGRIAVGGMLPAGGIDLPALLVEFARLHPDVEVELHEGTASEMLGRLRRDSLDVAIALLENDEIPAAFERRRLGRESLVVAMAEGHELSARKRIALNELSNQRLVTFRPDAAVRARVDRAFAGMDEPPRIAFETNDLSMMRSVAGRGLGVAIVPESVAEGSGPALTWRPLTPAIRCSVSLIWQSRPKPAPAAAEFIAFVLGA